MSCQFSRREFICSAKRFIYLGMLNLLGIIIQCNCSTTYRYLTQLKWFFKWHPMALTQAILDSYLVVLTSSIFKYGILKLNFINNYLYLIGLYLRRDLACVSLKKDFRKFIYRHCPKLLRV